MFARDRFVQIRVELLADRCNRLQSIVRQKIVQLFQHHLHARKNRRLFALAAGGGEAEFEVVDDGHKSIEQRAVRILDRLFLFARGSFFIIIEVRLTAEREIAEAIEIRLQTGNRIIVLRFGFRLVKAHGIDGDLRIVRLFLKFLLHVFRIAIKVMSSFCGCAPTKFRKSSMTRVTIAFALSPALARTDSIMRSTPYSNPSPSSASVTPSV